MIHGYIVKVGLDFQVIVGNAFFSRHFSFLFCFLGVLGF